MSSMTDFAVKLSALLSLAFLTLGCVELCKPHRIAKLTGLAWTFFSLGFASLSYSLFIMQSTWHLPNSKKPWTLISTTGGAATFFMVLGCFVITYVSFIKQAEDTARNAETVSDPQALENVWPPAPRKP